jgi:hypothetical protein
MDAAMIISTSSPTVFARPTLVRGRNASPIAALASAAMA